MIATRWRLVAGIAVVGTLVSVAVAFLREPRFLYSSPVLIGLEDGRLIDNQETARVKLIETYIPAARAAYASAHADAARRIPLVRVEMPPGSAMLLLASEGTAEDAPIHTQLHTQVIAALVKDHLETLEKRREALQRRLQLAEQAASRMQGQFQTLNSEATRLNAEGKILAGQLLALREWLSTTERESTDEALAGLRETRALAPPRRSDAPLGPSRLMVIAMGSLGSLAAGLLAALATGLINQGAAGS
jgi:uncharacterized protein involved in exopolysaccharide biosynthesis